MVGDGDAVDEPHIVCMCDIVAVSELEGEFQVLDVNAEFFGQICVCQFQRVLDWYLNHV